MEKRDLSRTFLAVRGFSTIVGFVTLGIKCLTLPKGSKLSSSKRKLLNLNTKTNVAQSYLLGQLARAKGAPSGIGSELLKFALSRVAISKENVGCHLIRLDCEDELVSYYERHGFEIIGKNQDDDLNQMIAVI